MKVKLYQILFLGAWDLFKMVYKPVLVVLILIALMFACNRAYAQETIPFTQEEVETLAKHNLERKKCLELNEINEREIDSLHLKVNLLEQQIELKDTTISNFESLVVNYEKVDSLRLEQNKVLIEESDEQKKIIKKQKRRLNFWRIFTPVSVTAVVIGSIFIK